LYNACPAWSEMIAQDAVECSAVKFANGKTGWIGEVDDDGVKLCRIITQPSECILVDDSYFFIVKRIVVEFLQVFL